MDGRAGGQETKSGRSKVKTNGRAWDPFGKPRMLADGMMTDCSAPPHARQRATRDGLEPGTWKVPGAVGYDHGGTDGEYGDGAPPDPRG